jgi:Heavy metal binding domain
MGRISLILAVALYCVLNAPAPDTRIVAAISAAATDSNQQVDDYTEGKFYCPMDADVRSSQEGFCPKCGMKLVAGVKDTSEYPINFSVEPKIPRVADLTRLTFGVVAPGDGRPVRNFEVVHEKLYHVFVVSQDLSFFLHTHPERNLGEDFHLDVRFPKPGMYRVLSDFYPAGGTPQLITDTVMIPGDGFSLQPAKIHADLSARQSENSHVELVMPRRIFARDKVSLSFRVTPDDGIEPYLGVMAHMLAASSDLIDMMHDHPTQALDQANHAFKDLQFVVLFPRPGIYRVWIQFQRKGVVNTAYFDIPVDASE